MTVINGIEIDRIECRRNEIKAAIANNEPIEDKLNVVIVLSNPCLYARRYILAKEFMLRMETETNVNLFVVELAYGAQQQFHVTQCDNPNHLQVRAHTAAPIWHKENLINIAVERLLRPRDYKAFAWIDADVEFDSASWAMDTLRVLNGCKDVVQLFSHCVDMASDESSMNVFNGFGYSYCKSRPYAKGGRDFWHPGFAWAVTRKAFERMGGLYDVGVLGSGDSIMALSLVGKVAAMTNANYHADYNRSMHECQRRMSSLRLGYTPGVIRHYFHGSKHNRKYTDRWKVLMKHQFSPRTDIRYDPDTGLLVPSPSCTVDKPGLTEDILKYFHERREDDE